MREIPGGLLHERSSLGPSPPENTEGHSLGEEQPAYSRNSRGLLKTKVAMCVCSFASGCAFELPVLVHAQCIGEGMSVCARSLGSVSGTSEIKRTKAAVACFGSYTLLRCHCG